MPDPAHWRTYLCRAPAHTRDDIRQSLRIAEWKASMSTSERPPEVELHFQAKQVLRDEHWAQVRGTGIGNRAMRAGEKPPPHLDLFESDAASDDNREQLADIGQRLDRLDERQRQVLEALADGPLSNRSVEMIVRYAKDRISTSVPLAGAGLSQGSAEMPMQTVASP